jgi:integrase
MIVCPDTKGNMLSVTAYRRMWDSYMSELNFKFGDFSNIINFKKPKSRFAPVKIPTVIPEFTAHWLRHTFITNMYFAGVDVLTAKEQAGHADIKTTMEIYTHLDKIYKKKQMNKMDEYFRLRDSLPKEEAN